MSVLCFADADADADAAHTHTTKGYLKSDYSKSKPDTPSAGTVSCKKAADPNRANLVVHVAGPKDGARSVTSLHMTLQL